MFLFRVSFICLIKRLQVVAFDVLSVLIVVDYRIHPDTKLIVLFTVINNNCSQNKELVLYFNRSTNSVQLRRSGLRVSTCCLEASLRTVFAHNNMIPYYS